MGGKARVIHEYGDAPAIQLPAVADEAEISSSSFLIVSLAFVRLFVHVLTSALGGYGYFRDELYYIACSEHLAWGYVDHPPLSILILAMNRLVLGDSLVALRFLPALAGAASVYVTGLMVRELGGRKFAISLACLAVIIAPAYLAIAGFYSMNAFDLLFWNILLFLLLVILKHGRQEVWLLFGLVAGLGLMNKISVLFLGFGLVIGLLLTPERIVLRRKWIWLGGLIAALIVLPNIVWQIVYGWPTLEFIEQAQRYKIASMGPVEFLLGQVEYLHPLVFPIWVAGLWYFFFHPDGKQYRLFGWMYAVIFVFLVVQNSKVYYLAPIYTILIAAGGVIIQQWIEQRGRKWMKPVLIALLALGGIATVPLTVPILPVESFIRYARVVGIEPRAEENNPLGALPQLYADCFGWEELTATVVSVHRGLSPKDQSRSLIYTQNYGEAGALNFFGRHFGLPRVVSGHNNYFLWGPGTDSVHAVIIVGGEEEDHLRAFENVQRAGVSVCTYCMPYENNLPIFVARGLKVPLDEAWSSTKHYN
ncbi:MAG: glycosyltransferase family 39 protein [Ignavibacteriales bacterium]|nr:glycosyltransferase family 39 protein [Ignavibacteriales bacterium]